MDNAFLLQKKKSVMRHRTYWKKVARKKNDIVFVFLSTLCSLLSEIKNRGGGRGSNRDTVFRHGDHGESSTCPGKGPTEAQSRSFLPDSIQNLFSIFLGLCL